MAGPARRDTTGSYVVGLAGLAAPILAGLSPMNPHVLSVADLVSMGSQFPELGLLALAVLPTTISGGIDLSVVATGDLVTIAAAVILRSSPELAILAIPAALLAGLLCAFARDLFFGGLLLAVMSARAPIEGGFVRRPRSRKTVAP